jgi:hypothetical protein
MTTKTNYIIPLDVQNQSYHDAAWVMASVPMDSMEANNLPPMIPGSNICVFPHAFLAYLPPDTIVRHTIREKKC